MKDKRFLPTCLFRLVFFLLFGFYTQAQSVQNRLTPADSLNTNRQKTVLYIQTAATTVSLTGLYQLWYANYPQSSFHFNNDNKDWLQMDKMGHFFSAYQLAHMGKSMWKWSGASPKTQQKYGIPLGLAYLTAVEIMDGFSSEWGASIGDVAANTGGALFYAAQEKYWNEQRILVKFSAHLTSFAAQRPNVLGSTFSERILKDYNGQTYWLSGNIHSFFPSKKIPKWLNLAFGMSATNMLMASGNPNQYREFHVSLDIDLSKIKTKSALLRTLFMAINTLKIPAPTYSFSSQEKHKMRWFYF